MQKQKHIIKKLVRWSKKISGKHIFNIFLINFHFYLKDTLLEISL